jgi:hypothetical protein
LGYILGDFFTHSSGHPASSGFHQSQDNCDPYTALANVKEVIDGAKNFLYPDDIDIVIDKVQNLCMYTSEGRF